MRKDILDHFIYHFFQVTILVIGFIAFIRIEGFLRIEILFFAIFSYVAIAILHQYLNHSLHLKIVIEYLLMGALSASLLFFALRGGIGF